MKYLAIYKNCKDYYAKPILRYEIHALDDERAAIFEERNDVFILPLPENPEDLETMLSGLKHLKDLLKNKIESESQSKN